MVAITKLSAREILDSRGLPTVEATIFSSGHSATASVPSGASTGTHEAAELRDGDRARYDGKGVRNAVGHIKNEIASAVVGKAFDQQALDTLLIELDGTEQKTALGANAVLAVSLAFARLAALEEASPLYAYFGKLAGNATPGLPQPCFNVLNGGKHADSGLSFQEFMLVPSGDTFAEKVEKAAVVIASLKTLLQAGGHVISVGDEGGFAPKLSSNDEALEIIVRAIQTAGLTGSIAIALDVAASSFYSEGKYALSAEQSVDSGELLHIYEDLCNRYPIISIEDGFAEEDWNGFIALNTRMGARIKVVGDDLVTTNSRLIQEAAEQSAINAVVIKPNQIGTISEAIAAAQLARQKGMALFASHRSGETADTAIADFSVGLSCEFIKAGSLARGERIVKYNRLMEIEEVL